MVSSRHRGHDLRMFTNRVRVGALVRVIALCSVSGLAASMTATAAPITIDFTGHARQQVNPGQHLTVGGFDFAQPAGSTDSFILLTSASDCAFGCNPNGLPYLAFSFGGIVLTTDDDAPFSLLSLDVGRYLPVPESITMQIIGTLATGGQLTATSASLTDSTFQTLLLDWHDLISVQIMPISSRFGPPAALDNFVVDRDPLPTPEPTTLLLVVTGSVMFVRFRSPSRQPL